MAWPHASGLCICGFSQDENDEVGNTQLVVEFGKTLEVPGFQSRFDDLFYRKANLPIRPDISRERPMKVRELDTHHLPSALAFIEVAIQNYVLFRPIVCSLPAAAGRTHRM